MAKNYDLNNTGPEVQARLDQVFPNQEAISTEEQNRADADAAMREELKAYTDAEKDRAQGAETALADRATALEEQVGSGGSIDTRITDAVAAETQRAQQAEASLQGLYEGLTQSDIVAGPLPETGEERTIYRVPGESSYADFMWNGTEFVKMAEYDNAIDNQASPGSGNLITSGAVYAEARKIVNSHTTSGADLDVADESGNVLMRLANGHVKTKNFDSSKNSLSEADVAKVAGIEAGAEVNDVITDDTDSADLTLSDDDNNVIAMFKNGHIKTKNFDSANVNTDVVTDDTTDADLTFSDEDNNVLAVFKDGHIKTKNFDSSEITNNINALKGKTVAILGASSDTHGYTGEDCNAVEMTIETADVGKTLSAYVTYRDVDRNNLSLGGTTYTADDIGNEVTFVPTAEDVGKVIGLANNYYANSMKVWWTYVRDYFGCKIIPVCWSGSGLTRNRESIGAYKAAYAWHESQIRKCGIRTPGTMDRTAPDVIIITRGLNDISHAPYAMLTDGYFDNYDVQYPTTDIRQDGQYGFKEAYFMTIGKLRERYPFTKIILTTGHLMKRVNNSHFPMNNGYYSHPQYNAAIREIADFCGCELIDFAKMNITWENMYPTYVSDSASTPTHPNALGHEIQGKFAIRALSQMSFEE